jgi:hypothetical protein
MLRAKSRREITRSVVASRRRRRAAGNSCWNVRFLRCDGKGEGEGGKERGEISHLAAERDPSAAATTAPPPAGRPALPPTPHPAG